MSILDLLRRKPKESASIAEQKRDIAVVNAIARLSDASKEQRVPIAMELLKSSNHEVRAVVASEVARLKINAVGAWYELANTLADDYDHVRIASAKAFWQLDGVGYAIRSLRDEYENPAHMTKKSALVGIRTLMETGPEKTVFIALLKDHWKDCPLLDDLEREFTAIASNDFEFPDGHDYIIRRHDALRDKWPGCNLEFHRNNFDVTIRKVDPHSRSVLLWDFVVRNVSIAEYQPERFDDWKPHDECECTNCTTDRPEKIQIHKFVILNKKENLDDEQWIKTLNKIIPQHAGYHLYERLFGGMRRNAARVLFLSVPNEKLKEFDLSNIKERLVESFGSQYSKNGFGNVYEWDEYICKRNVDPSRLTAEIEDLDPSSKTFIGERLVSQ